MLILGLLLLACTAAFVGLVISDNLGGGAEHDVTVFGQHIATMNGLAIFCAGLALALVFSLGVILATGGLAARHRRHRALRDVRYEADATARERDELAARLDRIHAEHAAAEGDALAGDRERAFATNHEEDLKANRAMGDTARAGGATEAGVVAGRSGDSAPRRRHGRHLFGH